jgi:hypothetical protein
MRNQSTRIRGRSVVLCPCASCRCLLGHRPQSSELGSPVYPLVFFRKRPQDRVGPQRHHRRQVQRPPHGGITHSRVRQAQQFGLVVRPSFSSPRGGKISSIRRVAPISPCVVRAAGPCRCIVRLPAILRVVPLPTPAPTAGSSPRSGRCGSHACAEAVIIGRILPDAGS